MTRALRKADRRLWRRRLRCRRSAGARAGPHRGAGCGATGPDQWRDRSDSGDGERPHWQSQPAKQHRAEAVRDKARLACMPVRDVTDRTDGSAGELVDPERRGELVEDMSSLAEAILEQIADAVIFADATGTIRRWNQAAAALFGYSAAEALGQKLDPIIPDHLRAAHWRGFAAALTGGSTWAPGPPTPAPPA